MFEYPPAHSQVTKLSINPTVIAAGCQPRSFAVTTPTITIPTPGRRQGEPIALSDVPHAGQFSPECPKVRK